jgi:flagellar motility protein MotE (MotC chaperone)
MAVMIMNKEEYDKYKKVVDELDGYDICDEFNLGTYELKDKKKLLEIVLMYYFKNQDELQEKDKEIERLNNEIKTLLKENSNKEKVIIKQNNIIGAIEKYLLELRLTDVPGKTIVYRLLDKLKALKEGNNND